MSGATFAERLVAAGLDASGFEDKRALFDDVLNAFAALRRGESAPHVWWVPGRLEVFGKHTDYAGGHSLVCAVPRGLALVAAARPDGQVQVVDVRRHQAVTLDPSADTPFTGWRHYVSVVLHRLARNFPGAALGADIVFASDLPRASGMSSSSALVVGIAAALGRLAALEERTEWQADIRTTLDAAAYYACLENGRSFGSLDGDAGVGTHGGSEDHAAIVASVADQLSAYAFVPMRHVADAIVPPEWRFVIAVSGVRAEKTGGARDSYNRLARGVDVLVELWNGLGAPAPSLGAALASSETASVRRRTAVGTTHVKGWTNDVLLRRLEHFVREDARIAEALEAFEQADAVALTRLSAASQTDAEALLGNQVPETIALARAAREKGAFAASSFGAGFGGSVWALVERDTAPDFAKRWHSEAFVAKPGPPLLEL